MAGTRRLTQLTARAEAVAAFPPGRLVVALSGGADSAALAYLAARRGPARAIHVQHGQAVSDQLAGAAEGIASALHLPLQMLSVTVEPWSEGAARQIRYQRLVSDLAPDEWILTGHTADDQAETVLAHLLRGTGLAGLQGIPSRRPLIARPLLAVTRSETRELATLAGLPWFDDPTNWDLGPLRNRLRLRLLPQLEAEYNPGFRQHLVELAAITAAGEEPDLLLPQVGEGVLRLPAPMLLAVSPQRATRSLHNVLRPWRGGYGLSRKEIDRVWTVLERRARSAQLAGGVRVERMGPWLVFTQGQPSGEVIEQWRVPGTVQAGRFRFEAVVTEDRPVMPLSPWSAVFDFDQLGEELSVEVAANDRPLVRVGERVIWSPGRWQPRAGWIEPATRRYLSALCVEEPWHQ